MKDKEILFKVTDNKKIYILPQRYNETTKECLFAEDSIEFYKFAKEQNTDIEFIESNPKTIALHDSTIWIPILFIAENILLPIVINLVSDFLKEKLGKKDKSKAEMDLKIKFKGKGKMKSIKYKGSVAGYEKAFKKADLNKLMDMSEDD
ncbi:MAG: hypothetical protein ACI4TT_02720 [Christensenellales bacterium]